LHWAAFEGYKNMAELLLANKADGNAMPNNGYMPLHLGAELKIAGAPGNLIACRSFPGCESSCR
jgi:hypothetical protein